MQQKPVPIGLVLCEQVIIEEKTRNITPVNCFSQRTVEGFPSLPFPFILFAIITDGLGDMTLEIVIQRLDTLDEIYRASVPFRFAHPLQEARCTFRIRNCIFPVAGRYNVMLLADQELVAQRRIRIVQTETPT